MKVLITGGAGFIGSHLAEGLLGEGHDVTAVDDLSTGDISNLSNVLVNPKLKYVQISALDERALAPLVEEVDLIYHLAASVGVKKVIEQLSDTLENNVKGTETILKLAHKFDRKKVILASTSEVYGKNANHPHKEDDDLTIGPASVGRWGYACSKMLDEFMALAYYKERDVPVIVLRLFNTVGPRQSSRYGMVIPNFVSKALRNEPITIHGDGYQTRCFIHVKHVVRGLIDIGKNSAANGHIFNMGNDEEITINELALRILNTLRSSSPIVHVPYQVTYGPDFEDIRRRVPDITKIKSYIEFKPVTDLADLINEVAETLRPDSATEMGSC